MMTPNQSSRAPRMQFEPSLVTGEGGKVEFRFGDVTAKVAALSWALRPRAYGQESWLAKLCLVTNPECRFLKLRCKADASDELTSILRACSTGLPYYRLASAVMHLVQADGHEFRSVGDITIGPLQRDGDVLLISIFAQFTNKEIR